MRRKCCISVSQLSAGVNLQLVCDESCQTDGFWCCQSFNCGTWDEFQVCVLHTGNQIYDVEHKLQYGDKRLLSTCDYAQENGRFVVAARKIVK